MPIYKADQWEVLYFLSVYVFSKRHCITSLTFDTKILQVFGGEIIVDRLELFLNSLFISVFGVY